MSSHEFVEPMLDKVERSGDDRSIVAAARNGVRGGWRCNLWLSLKIASLGITSLGMNGCGFIDEQRVSVTVKAQLATPAFTIERVSVISGADQFTWAEIRSGEEVYATLHPEAASDSRVRLIYTLSGTSHFWETLVLDPNQGYEVFIEIDSTGGAVGRSCVRPCQVK